MESARPAREEDLARCAELVAEARAAAGVQRGGSLLLAAGTATGGRGDTTAVMARTAVLTRAAGDPLAAIRPWMAATPDRLLLAGVFCDVVVGVAAGRIEPARPGAAPIGLVDCCYVEPDAREVGVGSALVAALLAWFSERGCGGVDAVALPGDRSTKQLFEAAGLSARLLVLHRPLP